MSKLNIFLRINKQFLNKYSFGTDIAVLIVTKSFRI